MAELLAPARDGLVEAGAHLARAGLVPGTSGNLSVRVGDKVAITPRGIACGLLRAQLIPVHSTDGSVVHAPLAPSSELPLHLALYTAPGIAAVVHTHSAAAVAVSTLVDELPAIHYYAAVFGAPVRVAPYAPFGSVELAEGALHALGHSSAVLLANHGAVTVGRDLATAVEFALTLEWLCDVYLRAAAAGRPRVIDDKQLVRAHADLDDYRAARPE